MYESNAFEQLVAAGNSTGEVVAAERFLVKVKGLDGTPIGALVMFQSGQRGVVREVQTGVVLVLSLDKESTPVGSLVVLEELALTTAVGEALIGRVITPLGRPLDGKEAVTLADTRDVFSTAPGILERSLLKDQLYSGVSTCCFRLCSVRGLR